MYSPPEPYFLSLDVCNTLSLQEEPVRDGDRDAVRQVRRGRQPRAGREGDEPDVRRPRGPETDAGRRDQQPAELRRLPPRHRLHQGRRRKRIRGAGGRVQRVIKDTYFSS